MVNFAQTADSVEVVTTDTVKKAKDKTVKVMVGDKELISVDVPADEFDMDDFNSEKKGDTTKLRVGKKNIIIIDEDNDKNYSFDDADDDRDWDDEEWSWDDDDDDYKDRKFKGHWGGIEIGLNNFLNSNQELQLPNDGQFMELNTSKSIEFNLNFADKSFPFLKNRMAVVTGMGFRWNNYHFDQNIKLNPTTNPITADYIDPDSINFSKNRLGVTYLTVPLLLEYQIPVGKKHKPIYFSAGAIGGLKLGSNLKQKYIDPNGNEKKEKYKKDYNISPFTYAITARIGYKNVNVFANYSMVSLFEKNKGPEIYPLTIGISLLN